MLTRSWWAFLSQPKKSKSLKTARESSKFEPSRTVFLLLWSRKQCTILKIFLPVRQSTLRNQSASLYLNSMIIWHFGKATNGICFCLIESFWDARSIAHEINYISNAQWLFFWQNRNTILFTATLFVTIKRNLLLIIFILTKRSLQDPWA